MRGIPKIPFIVRVSAYLYISFFHCWRISWWNWCRMDSSLTQRRASLEKKFRISRRLWIWWNTCKREGQVFCSNFWRRSDFIYLIGFGYFIWPIAGIYGLLLAWNLKNKEAQTSCQENVHVRNHISSIKPPQVQSLPKHLGLELEYWIFVPTQASNDTIINLLPNASIAE